MNVNTTAKSKQELEDIFRRAVHMILDLPDSDHKTVRFPYGSNPGTPSAPAFTSREDVIFVYVLPEDAEINKERHTGFAEAEGNEKLTYFDTHTDCHRISFVLYGPHAFAWARKIRDFICAPPLLSFLQEYKLFPQPGIAAPVPVPELLNKEWYERYDVAVVVNEAVKHEIPDATAPITGTEIITKGAGAAPKKERKKSNAKITN